MLNKLLGIFEMMERDQKLHELATRYHTECELYDWTVCTGPVGTINRNAKAVRKQIEFEAERNGFTREELARAIDLTTRK